MNYYFDSDNDSDTLSTFLNEFEVQGNNKPTLKQTKCPVGPEQLRSNPSFIRKTKATNSVPNNFNVDDEMHKAYNKYKSSIINEKQRKISDNIYAYYNSLNIICGKPGSGKSFLTCRDIIQLSRIPSVHCIKYISKYISKTGKCDDETFKSIIHLIKCPIDYLSEDNAEQHLRINKEYKDEYKSYKRKPRAVVNPKVMKFLHVEDLNNDVLNTVLLFEDFVGSKLIHNRFINWMFSELRHNNCIVYINIQFFKSITTDIKNNATAFFIYPGYSREQMQYMKRQISIPFNEEFSDFTDLFDRYSKMKNNEVLIINLKSNEIKFIVLKTYTA